MSPWYLSGPDSPPSDPVADPTTDPQLLDRLRAGDESALEALFRATYARLVRAAEHLLGDRGRAEDVVQEVMLELWRHRERLEPGTSLLGYLHRAVRNRGLNALRHERVRRQAEPHLVPEGPGPAADGRALAGDLEAAVRRAVARLPERCREVFELSRVHQLRYSEIASTMGISVKTVEAQMGKAIKLLRESLQPWLPAGG